MRYPTLSLKMIMAASTAIFVMGLFMLGIQTFVFVSYTQTFGDNNGKLWEDAYTGTGLANGIMCIFSALYFVLVIPERSTILLLIGIMLGLAGEILTAGSAVLAGLETHWLNFNANTESIHPCAKKTGNPDTPIPTDLDCTNWIYLEVTVAFLSALCFFFYAQVVFLITSAVASGQKESAVTVRNNVMNNVIAQKENDSVSSRSLPASSGVDRDSIDIINSYDNEFNPKFVRHLEQLSVQQQAIEDMQQRQKMEANTNSQFILARPQMSSVASTNYSYPVVPVSGGPPSSSVVSSRGALQMQYNQRTSTGINSSSMQQPASSNMPYYAKVGQPPPSTAPSSANKPNSFYM